MEMHEDFFKHKFPVTESSPPPAVGSYEAWRISYQSSEQAARAAFMEIQTLRSALKRARDLVDKYLVSNDPSEFGCACDMDVGYKCGPCRAWDRQVPLRAALTRINEVINSN